LKLYVMRHGPAEDRADSGMDSDRALTAPGRERVRAVARLLAELDEEPLTILTSPLVRAVQTAEIVAVVTKLSDRDGSVEVRRELSPGGGGGQSLIRSLADADGRRVMVVGHEPDLSDLTAALLEQVGSSKGTSDHPPHGLDRGLDKAMVVGLHIGPDGASVRLRFVLDPKALKLSPDARKAAP
jgi:phosphohistidine phosphatase